MQHFSQASAGRRCSEVHFSFRTRYGFALRQLGRVYHFSPPHTLPRQEYPPIEGRQVLMQEHVDFATSHSTYRCSKGSALLESPMTSQFTTYPSRKSIARAALVGLGLNGATGPLSHLLCAIVSKAVGIWILPSVLLVAWQEALASAVDHPRLLELLSHWVTFLSLLDTLGRLR